MANTFITIILFLVIIAGIIVLQIFLSKSKNKWLGLILPAVSFVISIFMVLGMVGFFTFSATSQITMNENGNVINHEERTIVNEEISSDVTAFVVSVIYIFLMSNIPSIILVGTYIACRVKLKRENEIEKMNIQDLE